MLQRSILLGQAKTPILAHSERVTQYTVKDLLDVLGAGRLEVIFRCLCNWCDNTLASHFFTMNFGLIKQEMYTSGHEAKLDLLLYIDGYYSCSYRHSSNDALSPKRFESNYIKELDGV